MKHWLNIVYKSLFLVNICAANVIPETSSNNNINATLENLNATSDNVKRAEEIIQVNDDPKQTSEKRLESEKLDKNSESTDVTTKNPITTSDDLENTTDNTNTFIDNIKTIDNLETAIDNAKTQPESIKGDFKVPGWKTVVKHEKLTDYTVLPVFLNKVNKEVSKLRETAKTSIKGDVIDVKFRRGDEESPFLDTEFAYHDKMETGEAGDVETFNRHLKAYERTANRVKYGDALKYLKLDDGFQPARRSEEAVAVDDNEVKQDQEILMHYAAPIDMKIYGYLQVPF